MNSLERSSPYFTRVFCAGDELSKTADHAEGDLFALRHWFLIDFWVVERKFLKGFWLAWVKTHTQIMPHIYEIIEIMHQKSGSRG